MNIAFGKYKGRKLIESPDKTLKPTMAMIKKNVFNLVNVKDKTMLDLFGGSGAVSFEALSIGAKRVVLVEKKHDYIDLIKKNHAAFFPNENLEVFRTDYRVALTRTAETFDFIFIDPPHGQIAYYKKSLELIEERNLLNVDGTLIFESKDDLKLESNKYSLYSVRVYGGIYLTIFKNKKLDSKDKKEEVDEPNSVEA